MLLNHYCFEKDNTTHKQYLFNFNKIILFDDIHTIQQLHITDKNGHEIIKWLNGAKNTEKRSAKNTYGYWI